MPSPDFIIPGATKSGTTSLHHYLDEHKDISMARSDTGSELNFFNDDGEYSKGVEYYESYFDDLPEENVLGEKSPSYFNKSMAWKKRGKSGYRWDPSEDSPLRISETYPEIKLIITLRNPATRAYSQYQKNYRQGREESSSFQEALEKEISGEKDIKDTPQCWIFLNTYPKHLGRWLELFDREQMKFLVFEKWIEDPEPTLNEVCRFLGVEPMSEWSRSDEVKNVGGRPRFVGINRFYQRYIEGTPLSTVLRRTGVTHIVDSLNSKEGYPEMTTEEWRIAKDVFWEVIDETEDIINENLDIWREEIDRNLQN
jgi:hypothetical protein